MLQILNNFDMENIMFPCNILIVTDTDNLTTMLLEKIIYHKLQTSIDRTISISTDNKHKYHQFISNINAIANKNAVTFYDECECWTSTYIVDYSNTSLYKPVNHAQTTIYVTKSSALQIVNNQSLDYVFLLDCVSGYDSLLIFNNFFTVFETITNFQNHCLKYIKNSSLLVGHGITVEKYNIDSTLHNKLAVLAQDKLDSAKAGTDYNTILEKIDMSVRPCKPVHYLYDFEKVPWNSHCFKVPHDTMHYNGTPLNRSSFRTHIPPESISDPVPISILSHESPATLQRIPEINNFINNKCDSNNFDKTINKHEVYNKIVDLLAKIVEKLN